MSYEYNPTVTELRQAYEVAYGKYGENYLIGALFANTPDEVINRLYNEALDKVKEDMDKMNVCVYCYSWYEAGTLVCPECNEYDGIMTVATAKEEGHKV